MAKYPSGEKKRTEKETKSKFVPTEVLLKKIYQSTPQNIITYLFYTVK